MTRSRSIRPVRRSPHNGKAKLRRLLIESLEHRELLAVDLEIPVLVGPSANLTLRAESSPLRLQLVNSGGGVVVQQDIGSQTDGVVNITRQGAGELPVDPFSDTIRIDLNSLQALNAQAFVGGGLTVNFNGGASPPLLPLSDEVVVLGASANLNYGFSLVASSIITLNGVSASFSGPLSLRSQPSTTGTSDSTDPTKVLAMPSAKIDISGGTISAAGVTLQSVATVNVQITPTSAVNGQVSFATVVATSDADVEIRNGASLTTTGTSNLVILADSNVTTSVGRAPSSDGNANDDDRQEDAAIANATIVSTPSVRIAGSNLTIGGTTSITSQNTVNSTTNADGRTGSSDAGGTVSVNTVAGATELLIEGTTTINSTGDLTLLANSNRTMVSNAYSTPRGVTDDNNSSTNTNGQTTLNNNNASTSDGNMQLAAAVAVTSLVGNTRVQITGNNATIRSLNGNFNQNANAQYAVSTVADSSSNSGQSGSNGSGIGVSAAIQTVKMDTLSLVSGTATIDGNNVAVNSTTLNNSYVLDAISGPSGSSSNNDVGIAGSLAIGTSIVNTRANIAPATPLGTAAINAGNTNLALTASAITNSNIRALPKEDAQGKSTGIGASFALNIVDQTTEATVANNANLTSVANLSLQATSNSTKSTEAKAGAKGGTAVAGAVAILVDNEDTYARLGSHVSTLVVTGNLTIQADHSGSATTKAEGDAEGGEDAGIGAAFALAYVNEVTDSRTDRNLNVTGNLSLLSTAGSNSVVNTKASATGAEKKENNESTDSRAAGNRNTANNRATTDGARTSSTTRTNPSASTNSGGSIAVSAALSINIPETEVVATLPNNRTIVVGGTTSIRSLANQNANTTSDASTTKSGDWGVGVGVAILAANLINEASIGTGVTLTTDGLTMEAGMRDYMSDTQHSFMTNAVSGAGGGDNGIAGSVAISIIDHDTQALIQSGQSAPSVTTIQGLNANSVTVRAIESTNSSTTARPNEELGGASGKSFGLGGSFALARPTLTTRAEVSAGANLNNLPASLNPTSLTIEAIATITTTVAAENGGSNTQSNNNPSSDSIGIGAGVALLLSANTTTAQLGHGNALFFSGDAVVRARHTHTLVGSADGNASDGETGVGISFGLNQLDEDVTATLSRTLSAANVTVEAPAYVESDLEASASAGGTKPGSRNPDQESNAQRNPNSTTNPGAASNTGSSSSLPSSSSQANNANSQAQSETGSQGEGTGIAAAVAVTVFDVTNQATISSPGIIAVSATNGTVRVSANSHFDSDVRGVGSAISLSKSDNYAGGVGFAYANTDSLASVGSSVMLRSSNIVVEAMTAGPLNAAESNDFVAWGASASGGTGDSGAAGSIAINVIDMTYSATTEGVLKATNNLTVQAENDLKPQTLAAGAAFQGQQDSSVYGGSLAYVNADITTTARIGSNSDAGNSLTVSAKTTIDELGTPIPEFDEEIAFSTLAVSGAVSGGDEGIAGAIAINDFDVDTKASIGSGIQINRAADVTDLVTQTVNVTADDLISLTSLAGALGVSAEGTGAGAGIELGIIRRDTTATIESGATLSSRSNILVDAYSKDDLVSVSANAGIGDSKGLAGSASVYVLTTNTKGMVESTEILPTNLQSAGDITIKSDGILELTSVAGAVGAAGTTAAGIGNVTLVHLDNVEASLGNSAVVNGGTALPENAPRSLNILANSSEAIIGISAVGAFAGDNALAGSATVLVMNETTTARIGTSANIDLDDGNGVDVGSINVIATAPTTIVSVAGTLSVSGDFAMGVGVDANSLVKNTKAYIDSNVNAQVEGDVNVKATSTEDVTSVTAGISASGSTAVTIDAGVHVFNITTLAFIGDEPGFGLGSFGPGHVRALGNIVIDADGRTEMDKVVGVLSASGTTGGAGAVGVSSVIKRTEAFLGDGAKVTAEGTGNTTSVKTGLFTLSTAPSASETNGINSKAVGANSSIGSLQTSGEVGSPRAGSNDVNKDGSNDATDPSMTSQRVVTPALRNDFRGLSITSTNRDDLEIYTFALGFGGTVGVAISAGVGIFENTTQAYVGKGAKVNESLTGAGIGQNVQVIANNDFQNVIFDGSIAVGGSAAISPAIGVSLITHTTNAFIDSNQANPTVVNARDDIHVSARASEDLLLVGTGFAGGGSFAFGGTVNVMDVDNTTVAFIGSFATILAQGDVRVTSHDESDTDLVSGALAIGGGGGIGAGVGVMMISKLTEAFIADDASVDAYGNGAAVPGVYNGGDNFAVTSANGVIVQAYSQEEYLHLAIVGAGGFVGVSGALGITLIDSDTNAKIGARANINQFQENTNAIRIRVSMLTRPIG